MINKSIVKQVMVLALLVGLIAPLAACNQGTETPAPEGTEAPAPEGGE